MYRLSTAMKRHDDYVQTSIDRLDPPNLVSSRSRIHLITVPGLGPVSAMLLDAEFDPVAEHGHRRRREH